MSDSITINITTAPAQPVTVETTAARDAYQLAMLLLLADGTLPADLPTLENWLAGQVAGGGTTLTSLSNALASAEAAPEPFEESSTLPLLPAAVGGSQAPAALLSLTLLKAWVLSGVSNAWASITGKPEFGTASLATIGTAAGNVPALNSAAALPAVSGENLTGLKISATDATTVGQAIAKLTNPGAVGFVRTNADNTVTHRTPAEVLTDIGAAPLAAVRHVFWPAGAMIPRTSTAPAAATIDSGTYHHMQDVYDFDSATAEYGCFVGYLEHWNAGTIKCRPCWKANTSSGDVIWGFQARAYADGDAIDQAFGTAQNSTDTLITTAACQVGPATAAITVAGTPANGRRLSLQVYRDAAAGGDTLAADARLLGVWIEYTEANTVEAAW